MRLILLTGIPATGKTSVGEHLAAEHGFRHLDFEDTRTRMVFWQFGACGFRKQLGALRQRRWDTVATWRPVPDLQLDALRLMRSHGFECVWFDGNRDAAHRVFMHRGSVSEQDWANQMQRIDAYIDLKTLRPRIVNPFDETGCFRPLSEVAADVGRVRPT